MFYFQENTPDIQSAIKFKLSYSLIQDKPRVPRPGDPVPSLNAYPILNQQEAAKTFVATFQKDCGDNDICESDLHIKAEFQLPKSKGTYRIHLKLQNELKKHLSMYLSWL